jgi:TrpR family trp operon transcriptional repressor
MKKLPKVLLSVKTKEEMEDLLQGLFTPAELQELEKRIEIIELLKQGVPQHEVAARLRVGIATVSRGARELKQQRFQTI